MDEEPESRITRLFDEYRDQRDRGRDPKVEELLQDVPGEEAQELRERIGVFESLHELKREMVPARAPLPERLGRFEIRASLGSGGLAHVYLALDPHLGREVALKVLDRGLVPDQKERAWILNEARSLALLKHPGVVRVFEVGSAEGYDFVAMEHLSGPTLAEVVSELSRLPEVGPGAEGEREGDPQREASRIARRLMDFDARAACFHQIASALAYCHNRGVIHRDIKPANVVFGEEGAPKLIDFGLAHLEDAGEDARPMITEQLVGSAAYIAPEQVESNQTGVDPRSDQFSLATLFYESLALVNPFEGSTSLQTTQAVLRCDLVDLRRRVRGVPADLTRIIHRGLERQPDDRYPTVQLLADDLAAFLEHRPISFEPPTTLRRTVLWTRRHWVEVIVGAALVLTLVLALLFSWITGVMGERSDVLAGLEGLAISTFDHEEDFWESGLELISLRESARASDASFGRAPFGDPLTPSVEEAVRGWSERMAVVFADPARTTSEMWPFLLRIEEELCPTCSANLLERERGIVVLPWEELEGRPWELLQVVRPAQRPDGVLETFEPCEPTPRLPPATYRLRVWEEDRSRLAFDRFFVVSRRRALKRPLHLERADRALLGSGGNPLLEEARLVHEKEYRLPSGTGLHMEPAFLVLPRFVTPAEFEAFRASDSYARYLAQSERAQCLWRDVGAAAGVDLDVAEAFAAWAGGRLPSQAELVSARDQDRLEPQEEVAHREWTRNVDWLDPTSEGSFFVGRRYQRGSLNEGLANAISRQSLMPEGGQWIAFRVVFSVD